MFSNTDIQPSDDNHMTMGRPHLREERGSVTAMSHVHRPPSTFCDKSYRFTKPAQTARNWPFPAACGGQGDPLE